MMSGFNEFDPDSHSEEERAAEEAERRQQAEIDQMDADLDDQLDDLQRLIRDDGLGFYMFGDRPGWVDKRLYPNTPK